MGTKIVKAGTKCHASAYIRPGVPGWEGLHDEGTGCPALSVISSGEEDKTRHSTTSGDA
jgi:hypothetical protein